MHIPMEERSKRLQIAREKIEIGADYYHFRNPNAPYKVIDVAIYEADDEPCVLYKPYAKDAVIWVRKVSSFVEIVENENGAKVSRFTKV